MFFNNIVSNIVKEFLPANCLTEKLFFDHYLNNIGIY